MDPNENDEDHSVQLDTKEDVHAANPNKEADSNCSLKSETKADETGLSNLILKPNEEIALSVSSDSESEAGENKSDSFIIDPDEAKHTQHSVILDTKVSQTAPDNPFGTETDEQLEVDTLSLEADRSATSQDFVIPNEEAETPSVKSGTEEDNTCFFNKLVTNINEEIVLHSVASDCESSETTSSNLVLETEDNLDTEQSGESDKEASDPTLSNVACTTLSREVDIPQPERETPEIASSTPIMGIEGETGTLESVASDGKESQTSLINLTTKPNGETDPQHSLLLDTAADETARVTLVLDPNEDMDTESSLALDTEAGETATASSNFSTNLDEEADAHSLTLITAVEDAPLEHALPSVRGPSIKNRCRQQSRSGALKRAALGLLLIIVIITVCSVLIIRLNNGSAKALSDEQLSSSGSTGESSSDQGENPPGSGRSDQGADPSGQGSEPSDEQVDPSNEGTKEAPSPVVPTPVASYSPSATPMLPRTRFPSFAPSVSPSLSPYALPSFFPTSFPTDSPTTAASRITTFYAIGDVPYNPQQERELIVQMRNVPADAEFVIHVGDIRAADDDHKKCLLEEYTKVADTLKLSHAPVFVIMGDNEINDCRNMDEGLEMWRDEFQGFESRFWNHTFDIQRQPEREENFAFVHKNTLFIGLNLVGGPVRSSAEWSTRLTEQVEWTKQLVRDYVVTKSDTGRIVLFGHANPLQIHNEFFFPLRRFIAFELENRVPFLYVNGDKHEWLYEPSFLDQPSFLRIMLTGGTSEPPLKVTVHANGNNVVTSEAFVHDRMLPANVSATP